MVQKGADAGCKGVVCTFFEKGASGAHVAEHCKSARLLFVDNMEISWRRVQESHCTRQQNTTHLDHTERQLRGSYCYGFDNNGDDIYHICNNAEIFEQKHTWVVKKGDGA